MNDNYKTMTTSVVMPWEEDFDHNLCGFANRDSFNTPESVRHPRNILAVGQKWQDEWVRPRHKTVNGNAIIQMSEALAVPALCVLDYQPIVAPALPKVEGDKVDWSETQPIDLWNTYHRDLNYINRVESLTFDPNDLHWANEAMSVGILSPLAFLTKCLDFTALPENLNNKALEQDMFLHAMGIDGLGSVPDNFRYYAASRSDLIRFINEQIIGTMNEKFWCFDFTNTVYYHASMVSRIWKETDDPQNYTALYTCRLSKMPRFGYTPQYEDAHHPSQSSDPYVHVFKDALPSTPYIEWVDMPNTLWDIAKAIYENVQFLVKDQDFRHIVTTMQTILEGKAGKAAAADGLTLGRPAWPNYPLTCRPVGLDYQPAMLLALHNATISDVIPSTVYQVASFSDPESEGELVSTLRMRKDGDYFTLAESANAQLLRSAQPYDMPMAWSDNTWQEQIVASMFKMMSYPDQPADELYISPKTCGFACFTKLEVWRPPAHYDASVDRYMPLHPDECFGYFLFDGQQCSTQSYLIENLVRVSNYAQLEFAPLVPTIAYNSALADENQDKMVITGYATNTQHVSFVEFRTLQALKEQYVRNGIGYPLNLGPNNKIGTFEGISLTNKAIAALRPESGKSEVVNTSDSSGGTARPSNKPKPKKEEDSNTKA